jgi:predicted peroxiredoxin
MNEQFFHKIRISTKLFSEAKALRVRNENMKKVIKAELMTEARDNGVKTITAQENYAYTHPEYKKAIQDLSEVIQTETFYYWELKTYEMEMEYWRTSQATKRAEMRLV